MNIIDVKNVVSKFEKLYLKIDSNEEKCLELMRNEILKESLNLVNETVEQIFDRPENNIPVLCINLVNQINSSEVLFGDNYRSALALLNSYEIFISTIYFLYKEDNYLSVRELALKKPVCCDYFNGDSYQTVHDYFELFNLSTLSLFIAEIGLNKRGMTSDEKIEFFMVREDESLIKYEGFAFIENLLANILPLNNSFYSITFRSNNGNREGRGLKDKINKRYDEKELCKLFGDFSSLQEIRDYIVSNHIKFSNYNLSLF